jgi:DNA-binding PadR family transcriptional regulator
VSLPSLSHKMYHLLYLLWHGAESGITLRELMHKGGWVYYDPHFYRDTKLLQEKGLIEVSQYSVREQGRTMQRKQYRLTDEGRRRLREQAKFYKKLSPPT